MTTTWLCCDLTTAVAEGLEQGSLQHLAGAEPVDATDRDSAYALLLSSHDCSPAATDLRRRLAPLCDPYPDALTSRRSGAPHDLTGLHAPER